MSSLSRNDASAQGADQYLTAQVHSASPAQLRLMLIEKAIEVAGVLHRQWSQGENPGPNEHSIKLLDLLNELLSGIVGNPDGQAGDVCRRVADLYVFLSQHLVAAESRSDAEAVDEIKTILEIEAETWRAVVARSANVESTQHDSGRSGIDFTG